MPIDWQATRATVRATLSTIRARVNFKLIRRLAVGGAAVGIFGIGVEAVVRAKLGSPLSRVPTAIYTRAEPWGDDQDDGPIALSPIGALAERRIPVARQGVPRHLVEAILAMEDQRFYRHIGLDPKRIAGALVANLKAGEVSQGGSTITQQLAKNLFLSAERTPLRKLREAAMAVVLEARYDKATILEAYLNEIYFGQDGGTAIKGVGAAAQYYFGKPVGKVTLADAALLAGLIQAPNAYTPIRHERVARRRRNLVLGLMAEQQRIGRGTAAQASKARIGTRSYPASTLDARYFRDFVGASLAGGLPARGTAVYTTLDPTLQRAAERAVRDGVARLRSPDAQAAIVAIDPTTGDILAMVGGRSYPASQFNRATDARRQPGSAFKPIVALAAFQRDQGHAPAFTLASRVDDEPLSVATSNGRWEPSNYDRSFRGPVTVREAIEQSLNVPFARIGLEIGPERIVATARKLGITSPLRAVPSLALGSSEVTLLELVRAYGVFATGGQLAATRVVLGRGALGGTKATMPAPPPIPVADPAEAFLVTSALEGVITRGTGRGLDLDERFGSIAGKTGTSNEGRDAWFIAYSPSLVVGAWVGFDDGRSVGLTGAGSALPVVARFFAGARPDQGWGEFPVPEGIETASVAGGEPGWSWDCGGQEFFLEGTAPENSCGQFSRHRWFDNEPDDSDDDDDEDSDLDAHRSRALRLLQRLLERAAAERDRQ